MSDSPITALVTVENGGNGSAARTRTDEIGRDGVLRDGTGRYLPGTCGGPGRFPAGRRESIETLERMLATAGNQLKLREDLQRQFDKGPAAFLLRFVYPLLPRNAISIDADGHGVAIKIIGGVREDTL